MIIADLMIQRIVLDVLLNMGQQIAMIYDRSLVKDLQNGRMPLDATYSSNREKTCMDF